MKMHGVIHLIHVQYTQRCGHHPCSSPQCPNFESSRWIQFYQDCSTAWGPFRLFSCSNGQSGAEASKPVPIGKLLRWGFHCLNPFGHPETWNETRTGAGLLFWSQDGWVGWQGAAPWWSRPEASCRGTRPVLVMTPRILMGLGSAPAQP